ncbi:hypothetical protein LSH36_40g03100 [Paralvinella palmiformis]|uniref:Uncharacterized protein n=1 Tax=Paralvinella palmiformis TaxID=53620 RepID=A0AAD9NGF6_9ANNE|nr:hypothetical protein LSH36_40g03100 [Paralvinella palmiformis]
MMHLSYSGILYLLFTFVMISEGNHDNLEQVLHHYELLHHSDITYHHHVTKRRADSGELYHNKIISFDALERYCDDTDSMVSAYWEDDDLVARIRAKDDTYIVEPLWRHLSGSDGYNMLTYRASDVKLAEERNTEHPAGSSDSLFSIYCCVSVCYDIMSVQ